MSAFRRLSSTLDAGDLSIVLVLSSRGDVGVRQSSSTLDARDLSIVLVLAKTTLLVESQGIGLVKLKLLSLFLTSARNRKTPLSLFVEREESKNSSLSRALAKVGFE